MLYKENSIFVISNKSISNSGHVISKWHLRGGPAPYRIHFFFFLETDLPRVVILNLIWLNNILND